MDRIKIPNKIFTYAGGGLGDIYYLCLMDNWAYFKDIKKQNPKTKIHAVLSSPNPLSQEVMEYNPYIDKLDYIKPNDRRGMLLTSFKQKGYTDIAKIDKKKLKKDHTIYTNKEDKIFIKNIQEQVGSKYIVIHPYSNDALKKTIAGQRKSRYVFPVQEYFSLTEKLIKKGYKIVILGGNARNPKLLKEEFLYKNDNIINLIDKTNARTAANVIIQANGFIGTYSCFIGIAWWYKTKSFLLAPNEEWGKKMTWKQRIESWHRWAWATKEKQNKILYLPAIENAKSDLYEKTRQQIINWF